VEEKQCLFSFFPRNKAKKALFFLSLSNLKLDWVIKHIEVLYPAKDEFEMPDLNGIVLWKDKTQKKYQLLEGNHRISSWLLRKTPESLSSIIFIGEPRSG
jgi:hypothetical protein